MLKDGDGASSLREECELHGLDSDMTLLKDGSLLLLLLSSAMLGEECYMTLLMLPMLSEESYMREECLLLLDSSLSLLLVWLAHRHARLNL